MRLLLLPLILLFGCANEMLWNIGTDESPKYVNSDKYIEYTTKNICLGNMPDVFSELSDEAVAYVKTINLEECMAWIRPSVINSVDAIINEQKEKKISPDVSQNTESDTSKLWQCSSLKSNYEREMRSYRKYTNEAIANQKRANMTTDSYQKANFQNIANWAKRNASKAKNKADNHKKDYVLKDCISKYGVLR